ncbi:hypothetical protein GIB67_039847 [Kingdonia uniflora]|uniref:Uncharacterized protein n=1 Tax=Kingdonia uniflora TaxID=39325 RepID=A0A7J7P366_9MAGN|nr:hypothetical protein GIB67_039847 [Kingdonia uniflora]
MLKAGNFYRCKYSFMGFMHKVFGWLNSFVTNELFEREYVVFLLIEIMRKQSLTMLLRVIYNMLVASSKDLFQ